MSIRPILFSITLFVSICNVGCSIYPYKETFMCENMNDYGKCLDVHGAYTVATTGEDPENSSSYDSKKPEAADKFNERMQTSAANRVDPKRVFEQERYRQLSKLVEQPSLPLVKQPEVVRTLIINYSDNSRLGSPLYGHRFVYFFGTDPEWVLSPHKKPNINSPLPTVINSMGDI